MNGKTQVGLETIERILREAKPLLEKEYKVKTLGIFGSYVRKEQRKRSDLDLLVEFAEAPGLFSFIRLENFLSNMVGVKVDLVMKGGLKPGLKERIINEVQYV